MNGKHKTDYQIRDRVSTPYGPATVMSVNPVYGCKVRFISGQEDWFTFWEISPLKTEVQA